MKRDAGVGGVAGIEGEGEAREVAGVAGTRGRPGRDGVTRGTSEREIREGERGFTFNGPVAMESPNTEMAVSPGVV